MSIIFSYFFLLLYKANPPSWFLTRFFYLKFCQGHCDVVELHSSTLVDVVLVVKNVFDVKFQFFEVFA